MSKVCLYQGRGFSNQSGPRSLYPCMKQQLIKWLRLYRVKLLSGLWLRQGCELRAQTPPFTWGLFFGVGPAMASLYKNSGGAPFVRAGTPDPSLALITADQFDNRIDCEKDFFIQFPRRPYSQWKRKYSAISYPRSERGLAKKGNPQKRGEIPDPFISFHRVSSRLPNTHLASAFVRTEKAFCVSQKLLKPN